MNHQHEGDLLRLTLRVVSTSLEMTRHGRHTSICTFCQSAHKLHSGSILIIR